MINCDLRRVVATHNHMDKRLNCVVISRIVLPVCRVSIFAMSSTRLSRALAILDRTVERNDADLDHTPESKTACALSIAFATSSAEADVTLFQKHTSNKEGKFRKHY